MEIGKGWTRRLWTLLPDVRFGASGKRSPVVTDGRFGIALSLLENMGTRGIREVTAGEKPDLAVAPHTQLQQKYSVQQYTQWGYGPGVWPYYEGYYSVWAGAPYTYSTINSYTEGTLILDFVDTSEQKLVFRGIGTGTVSGNVESNAEKVREAVKKIVEKFPAPSQPRPASN